MFCKKIMVSLISMTAVCGMGIAAPSVRATTTSPSTVDTTVRAGTLRVPMARSTTTTSGVTSVKNDTTGSSPRMAYISGTGIGKLSTRLQQPAPASASALSELERKVRELTDYVANVPETATEAKSTAEANATEITTLRSELGGKLDAEDFAEQFDTRATEKSLIDSDTVSSVYATKEELSSVPTSRAFTELTGRVDDAAADILTLNTELGRKLDKDTADGSYASIAALQGVKNTADAAVTPTMLNTTLAEYAKTEDLENIPSSEAFTSLSGRVGSAETNIATLQSNLAGKANAGDSYTKSESDAQLQAAKTSAVSDAKAYADEKFNNIEIPDVDLSDYYKSAQVDTLLANKAAASDVATLSNKINDATTGLDTKLSTTDAANTYALKSALNGLATEGYVTNKINDIAIPDVSELTGRVDTAETNIATLQSTSSGHTTAISDINTALTNKLDTDTAADTYALKSELNDKANASVVTALSGRVDTAEGNITALQSTTSGHTTAISDINTALTNKLDTDTAANTYATKQQLDEAQLGGHDVDLSGYLTTADAANTYATQSALNDKADAGDLTTLSNKVNDATTGLAATYALASSKLDSETADATYAAKTALNDKADASVVTALSGRVDTAEGNITALQTGLAAKADAEDVYTKAEVNTKIAGISSGVGEEQVQQMINTAVNDTIGNNYYDQDTADSKFATKSDLNGLATEGYVTEQINGIEIPDLTDLTGRVDTAESDIATLQSNLADKANASDVTTLSNKINDATTGLDTKLSATDAANTYALKSALNGLATEEYVTEQINGIEIPDLTDLTGRVDTAEGNITALQSTTSGHTNAISDINTALTNKLDTDTAANTYALKSELNDKANVSDVYTKAQVDDAIDNAVTGGQVDLSNYYRKSETYSKEESDALLANKAAASDVTTLSTKVNDATTGLAATYALASSKLDSETADATYAAKAALNDKADASVVTALSGRVDTAEGNITDLQSTTSGHTTAISDINTALTNKLDTDTAANTYALKTELSNKANASDVTTLSNKVNNATTGLAATYALASSKLDSETADATYATKTALNDKADASAVTALSGRVGTAEGNITALQTTTAGHTTTLGNINTALNAKLDTDTAAATYATKTALQGVQATAEAAVTPLLLSDTLSGYATKEYAASLAPDVELDYDSNTNALVYRNSPTDEWRSIPISGLKGTDGTTPLLEANDARQAIRVSYDNGQTYTTLVPYETLKGPKGDKGDPGCDEFETETVEAEGGTRLTIFCVKND